MLKNVLLSVCMRLLSIDDLNSFIFIDNTVRFRRTHLLFFSFCAALTKASLVLKPLALDGKGLLLQRGSYCLLNEQMSDDPCLFSSSLLVSALILPVLLGQINLKHSLCPFLLLSPDLQWLLIGC